MADYPGYDHYFNKAVDRGDGWDRAFNYTAKKHVQMLCNIRHLAHDESAVKKLVGKGFGEYDNEGSKGTSRKRTYELGISYIENFFQQEVDQSCGQRGTLPGLGRPSSLGQYTPRDDSPSTRRSHTRVPEPRSETDHSRYTSGSRSGPDRFGHRDHGTPRPSPSGTSRDSFLRPPSSSVFGSSGPGNFPPFPDATRMPPGTGQSSLRPPRMPSGSGSYSEKTSFSTSKSGPGYEFSAESGSKTERPGRQSNRRPPSTQDSRSGSNASTAPLSSSVPLLRTYVPPPHSAAPPPRSSAPRQHESSSSRNTQPSQYNSPSGHYNGPTGHYSRRHGFREYTPFCSYYPPPNFNYNTGGSYGSSSQPGPDFITDQQPKTCFYQVLGVPRSASADDIKKAYRVLSLEHHPDRVADEDKAKATGKMAEINQANDILSNAQKRRYYDRTEKILSDLDM